MLREDEQQVVQNDQVRVLQANRHQLAENEWRITEFQQSL